MGINSGLVYRCGSEFSLVMRKQFGSAVQSKICTSESVIGKYVPLGRGGRIQGKSLAFRKVTSLSFHDFIAVIEA